MRARLFSVEGVLVESALMLRKVRGGPAAAVRLVLASGAELVPTTEDRAKRALVLMAKYDDVPMDWVDAMLVAVAEEQGARDVLTLDRRGFSAYRLGGRQRFRIFPSAEV